MATNVEKMMKDYFTAWNSHKVDKITSFFTDDCVYEDVATGFVRHGKKEQAALVTGLFDWSPDYQLELKSAFGGGVWAASEWVMTGTQSGDISTPRIAATGRRFSIRGASITELRNGKISRNTDYWDWASFLRQVGMMPGAPSE